eukprot:TRINITY_DN10573_c0_g4_i1.p1 TRINITY_DN10573_c0_g4~~TRINITY_DN10573_c0_g4_i1.p1  ORF type:complete len:1371 (-),score=295.71 TRINITY_DN10573_c0_g4_i1:45-4121(-)
MFLSCDEGPGQRPSSQSCSRSTGRLPTPGVLRNIEIAVDRSPWCGQDWSALPADNISVLRLPTHCKSEKSLAKYARQRSGLGSPAVPGQSGSQPEPLGDQVWSRPGSAAWSSAPQEAWSRPPSQYGSSGRQVSAGGIRFSSSVSQMLSRKAPSPRPKGGGGALQGRAGSWQKSLHAGSGAAKKNSNAWGSSKLPAGSLHPLMSQLSAAALRRRQGATESDVLSKKANAARALALDRQRIQENHDRFHSQEIFQTLATQRRQFLARQLLRLFRPIEAPHEHVPVAWKEADIAARETREHKCQKPEHWANIDLNSRNQSELSSVCSTFAALMKPCLLEGKDSEIPDSPLPKHTPAGSSAFSSFDFETSPILTRPAFCRMLVDLNLVDANGDLIYHVALDLFDALAGQTLYKGCPLTSGSVLGIPIDEYDDKILQLFSALLFLVYDDDNARGVITVEDLKAAFFDHLVKPAEKKGRKRQRHILRQVAHGKDIYRAPDVKNMKSDQKEEEQHEVESAADEVVEKPEKPEKVVHAPDPPRRRASKFGIIVEEAKEADKLAKAEKAEKEDKPEQPRRLSNFASRRSIRLGQPGHPVPAPLTLLAPPPARRPSNHKDNADLMSQTDCGSPKHETASVCSSTLDQDEAQPDEDVLYAHTLAVSKGEFLSGMLLEPEVLQMVWMFYENLSYLFEVYADIGTNFLETKAAHGGHMSAEAFVRFCIDFNLVPGLIDFNALMCVYWSAESYFPLKRDELKRCVAKDVATAKMGPGDVVMLAKAVKSSSLKSELNDLKPGETMKVLHLDCQDYDAEACYVITKSGKKTWFRTSVLLKADKSFNMAAKQSKHAAAISSKASWINKPPEEMTQGEQKSLQILSAFADYMTSRKLRSKDFFGKFDDSGDSMVDAKELMKGVVFMTLGGGIRTSISTAPPTQQEVQECFELIDADGSGELDYQELDIVMKTVQDRKARSLKGENVFIKDDSEMSSSELAATQYFVPLYHALEAKGWTAKDFFEKFDGDGNGTLSQRELLEAGREIGIDTDIPNFDRALMLLDSNIDGAFSVSELQRVLSNVKDSLLIREKKEKGKQEPQNPYLPGVKSDPDLNAATVDIFGKKAFIESIFKIGFGFLSFHGTPEQSTLPAATKALWLLTYLQWQMSPGCREKRSKAAVKVMGSKVNDTPSYKDAMYQQEDSKPLNKKLQTAMEKFGVKRQNLDVLLEAFGQKGYRPRRSHPKSDSSSLSDSDDEGKGTGQDDVHGSGAYNSRMERLQAERPNLFREGPTRKPCIFVNDYTREEVCPDCKFEPVMGWGNPTCSLCGQGGDILRATLAAEQEHQERAELPVLDRLVCLLGTTQLETSPVHQGHSIWR